MTTHTTLQRAISFSPDTPPSRLAPDGDSNMSTTKTGRRRRSSSLIYQEPPESLERISDQSALPNLNSQWVNAKGTINASREQSPTNQPSLPRRMDDPLRLDHLPEDLLRHHPRH